MIAFHTVILKEYVPFHSAYFYRTSRYGAAVRPPVKHTFIVSKRKASQFFKNNTTSINTTAKSRRSRIMIK